MEMLQMGLTVAVEDVKGEDGHGNVCQVKTSEQE